MTALHELARVSAERMLNGVVEGSVIALFVGLLLRLMGRRNSGMRFAVLLAALFSIAALPFLNVVKAGAGVGQRGAALWSVTMPGLWATYLVLAWVAIATVGLLRVALGLWQLRRLRTGSETVDAAGLDPLLRRTLSEFRSSRPVGLAVSEKQVVPAAVGFFHPMVVLPAWSLRELSSAELNSILIHELAHLQRRDDWTNLAQKVLRALLFFHPAIWWVERQLSLEREMACDDVVLSRTDNPREYAGCLVAVAERSFMRRGLALAQAAVSKMRHTTLRVSQILDGNRAPAGAWKPLLGLVAVASGIVVFGLARAPELVAFRDGSPLVSSSVNRSSLIPVVVPVSLPKDSAKPVVGKAVLASFQPRRTQPSRAVAKPIIAKLTQTSQPATETPAKVMPVSEKQNETTPQTVLLVLRTEQNGPAGTSWTVQVWRFTLLKAEQVPIALRFPAKSL